MSLLERFKSLVAAEDKKRTASPAKKEKLERSAWNLWMKKRFSEPIEDRRARNQEALRGRGLSGPPGSLSDW